MSQAIRDIISKSEIIIDSVPFLAATINDTAAKFATSWDYSDVFEWGAFEGRPLDLKLGLLSLLYSNFICTIILQLEL